MQIRYLTPLIIIASIIAGGAKAQVESTTSGPPAYTPNGPTYLAVVSPTNNGGVCVTPSGPCVNPSQGISLSYFATSSDLASANGTIGNLQTTLSGQTSALSALDSSVGSLQTTATGQASALSTLNGSVDNLEDTVNEQGTSLNTLNGTVTGLTNTVDGQVASVSNLQTGLAALQTQIGGVSATINTSLASFQRQLSDITAAMTQMDQALRGAERRSDQGIAMALASGGGVQLQQGENFAIAMNVATFRGQSGNSIDASYRLADHVALNASVVGSVNGGAVAARAGIRFGW